MTDIILAETLVQRAKMPYLTVQHAAKAAQAQNAMNAIKDIIKITENVINVQFQTAMNVLHQVFAQNVKKVSISKAMHVKLVRHIALLVNLQANVPHAISDTH